MKKVMTILMTLCMAAVLAACGGGGDTGDNRVVTDWHIDVPEGFTQQEMEGLDYYCVSEDGSNINMTILDKTEADDATFDEVTVEMLREALEEGFRTAYSMEVSVDQDSLAWEPVCDFPAYQYSCTYELSGVALEQLIVCINADKIYTITYTDVTGEWMEQFRTSAANIQLTTEG